MIKNGLNYLAEGEQPEPVAETEVGKSVPVGRGAKQVIANESVLDAMSRLYAERQAKAQGFGEAMKDASAWWSGGIHGPTEGLARRDEQRRAQAGELFKMQADIAAQKAALENRDYFFGTGKFGQPAGAQPAGAQPAQGGTQPTNATVAQVDRQTGGLLGLVNDPNLRQAIGAMYLTDPKAAMTSLMTHLSKRAEEPMIKKEVDYLVASGLPREQALPIAIAKVAGSGSFVPHDIRTPGGTQQTTPLGAATNLARPNAAPATAPSAAPAAPAAPAAAPSAAPATATSAAPAAKPAAAAAPATSAVPAAQFQYKPTGFTPGSKEDLEAKAEQYKAFLRASQEEQAGRGKTDATTAESLEKAGASADKNIRTYEIVKNILHETPRAVGIAYRSGPGSAAIKFVEEGATIPFAGSLRIPGMEEAIARGTLTPKELENRAVFNGLVGELAMAYKKEANAGMGSQSDADAKAAEVAFGLSSKNPAKANLIFAILQMEKEKLSKVRNEGWKEFQRQERAAGRVPEFRQYQLSAEYQNAAKQNDRAIRDQLPDLFNEKGSTAPTQLQEGQRSKSKSGRDIVVRNGKWVYDNAAK